MSAFYDLSKTPRNILNQAIVRAIVSENNGLLFDIGDMSYLYQDAAGTIPVTAVEQPVGKIIDKSGNGNHATQSITASRPVLSARYNLLTKTEDFSDAVWSTTGVNILPNTAAAPDGSITADSLSFTLGAKVTQAILGVNGKTVVYSKYVKENSGSGFFRAVISNTSGTPEIFFHGWFNTQNGTWVQVGAAGGAVYYGSGAESLGNGWYRVWLIGSIPAASNYYVWDYITDTAGSTVRSLTVSQYWWGEDVTIGNTLGPYQRVNTAMDYETDPRYFPKYLKFDGIDDYLNLPYMGLYGGGAASIIAARDAVSQATDTYIISERSTSNANPKYFPSRQLASGGNMDSYISDDTAAVVLDTTGSAFSGASDKVIRTVVDAGNNIKLFKNRTMAADENYTRSGALTLNTTTIGASVSTTTSNYASMKLYGLIITKSALTDAQRVRCERFLAQKAGVML